MENKKMTKKEKFAMIKEYIKDNEMLMEFIDNEINLLTKKASSLCDEYSLYHLCNLEVKIGLIILESS